MATISLLFLAPAVYGQVHFDAFVEDPVGATVVDSTGVEYDTPFFGGFNNPVPQLVDIDDDGDLDLFVQEERSRLQFYKNVGSASSPKFVFSSRYYQELDVGDWYRFADLDGDGDYDLFADQPFNAIKYFENTGESGGAVFELRVDSVRTSDQEPVITEPPNVPVIEDFDCNGLVDMLLGKVSGSVTRYEQVSSLDGTPIFDFVEDNFQDILVIGPFGKDEMQLGSRHGANVLAAGDLDGNGTTDLLWGDFFSPSLITFTNSGSDCSEIDLGVETDTLVTINEGPFITRGYNAPAAGDLTGDGAPDLVVGVLSNAAVDDERNLFRFDNDGTGHFLQVTDEIIRGIDVGSSSVPASGDVNGDGRYDLVIANSIGDGGTAAELVVYMRAPGSNDYMMSSRNLLQIDLGFGYHPEFGDLDGDGDDDLVLGLFNGTLTYLENTGFAADTQFVVIDSDMTGEDVGSNSAPLLVDLDSDGDLDLVVGESSGELNYYRNTGTPLSYEFEPAHTIFEGIDVGQGSLPAALDSDGDGDYDLVVGSESSGLIYIENSGSVTSPEFSNTSSVPLSVPRRAAPEFVDGIGGFTGLKLLVGNASGGLLLFGEVIADDVQDEPKVARLSSLDLYPNPTTGVFRLVFSSDGPSDGVDVTVVDILGRERIVLEENRFVQSASYDISGLADGVYFVVVNDNSGFRLQRPVVKVSSK